MTNSFSRNLVWLKLDFSKFRKKLPLLSRDCFATYSFSWKLFRYSLTCEKRVFSVFNVANMIVFHILSFPSLSLSRTIFNPKHYFIQTPLFSSKFSAKSFQGMYFLHYSHLLFSDYAEFMLRVLKFGDFWKLGWISFSSEFFFFLNLWLGCVPFAICASMLAPCGNLIMYWGLFPYVHAFFITVVHCCMSCVWQIV